MVLPLVAMADNSGKCGENLKWMYVESTHTLTISGTGRMDDYNYSYHRGPWSDYQNDIQKVVIESGVTSIGAYAFDFYSALTTVTIPSSVTSIGEAALEECRSLSSISIPNSVTSIGKGAFGGCGLTSVTIPNSVTSIGIGAFTNCHDLTAVTISSSVTTIDFIVFAYCENLSTVNILDGVKTIGQEAFEGCTNLTSITLPNSVTSIEKYAFSGCRNLASVTIGNNLTNIGYDAFRGCRSLHVMTCYTKKAPHLQFTDLASDVDFRKATLYVPMASVSKYRVTWPWSQFGTIVGLDEATQIAGTQKPALHVLSNGGWLTVSGAEDGEQVNLYDAKGILVGSATIKDGQATIKSSLRPGSVAILRMGAKPVKVIVR